MPTGPLPISLPERVGTLQFLEGSSLCLLLCAAPTLPPLPAQALWEHQLLSPMAVTPQRMETPVLPGQHRGRGSLVSLPQTRGQLQPPGLGKQPQKHWGILQAGPLVLQLLRSWAPAQHCWELQDQVETLVPVLGLLLLHPQELMEGTVQYLSKLLFLQLAALQCYWDPAEC